MPPPRLPRVPGQQRSSRPYAEPTSATPPHSRPRTATLCRETAGASQSRRNRASQPHRHSAATPSSKAVPRRHHRSFPDRGRGPRHPARPAAAARRSLTPECPNRQIWASGARSTAAGLCHAPLASQLREGVSSAATMLGATAPACSRRRGAAAARCGPSIGDEATRRATRALRRRCPPSGLCLSASSDGNGRSERGEGNGGGGG